MRRLAEKELCDLLDEANAAGYVCGVNNAPPACRFFVSCGFAPNLDADRTGLPEYLTAIAGDLRQIRGILGGISAVNGLPLAY